MRISSRTFGVGHKCPFKGKKSLREVLTEYRVPYEQAEVSKVPEKRGLRRARVPTMLDFAS